jgi:hypothetical protein
MNYFFIDPSLMQITELQRKIAPQDPLKLDVNICRLFLPYFDSCIKEH